MSDYDSTVFCSIPNQRTEFDKSSNLTVGLWYTGLQYVGLWAVTLWYITKA